jgi:coenzyme F420-reducing hydrogenase beta subunit
MINITSKEKCCGCSGCYNACPKDCINMYMDDEGFLYPEVNRDICVNCRLCEKVCPMLNPNSYDENLKVYACKNKNQEIKFKSSSGGVFSILSQYVIESNGVVFGAGFDDKFQVVHMMVDNIEDLQKLRGSKYVQSDIGNSFESVKVHLEKNRLVLFSGTPCQVSGLKNYLNKDYNNLILVDVVCHGVPSPGIFIKYLDFMKKVFNSSIQGINFRAKELAVQALKICFINNKIYLRQPHEDLYYKAFLSNLILRPSCYDCKANNFRSGSDIALADYWGASTRFPDFDEKEGVSLVIIKTQKGNNMFRLLQNKFETIESDIEHAIQFNPNIIKSSEMNLKREEFFSEYKKCNKSINKCLRKYVQVKFYQRVLGKLSKWVTKRPAAVSEKLLKK